MDLLSRSRNQLDSYFNFYGWSADKQIKTASHELMPEKKKIPKKGAKRGD